MQLLATEDFYLIKSVNTILKCCRYTSNLSIFYHSDISALEDLELIGDVFAFIGKVMIDGISYLLFVTQCSEAGENYFKNDTIYQIEKVCALPILADGMKCKTIFGNINEIDHLERLKNQPKKIAKMISHKMPMRNLPISPKLIDEIVIFNILIVVFLSQPDSFYFSHNFDITRSLQSATSNINFSDSRFFWNRQLLDEFFVRDGSSIPAFKDWITPIIHGYVSQQTISFYSDSPLLTLTLISRRSIKRAGVRYLRRGIDEEGDVANFVETEFIVCMFGHCLSFVQALGVAMLGGLCRGSVPVFWSQKGYRLKPPLIIDRPIEESLPIFSLHIKQMFHHYSFPLVIVNLADQTGREAVLCDAYLQHILAFNCDNISYHSFDFHQICGNRKHHKLSELMDELKDKILAMGFCWIDKSGKVVMQQKGIIRTNCIDCLDRTNVVQCAISQVVCLIQCRKLGIVEAEDNAPEHFIKLLQRMWADHGDLISKQYAGTSALKGDITRNGQRKISGFVKDGYNSASRYYLSQMCDANRQRVIDAILGLSITDEAA
ncbi:SAC domain-containing protein [Meloidogyne graminicola]|uniref:SAC domain-containing protein n=1 Tax=Meloidogyne graminicola TaxID=189291 RepID=A0A8T0A470_9BILA|nr:SAC domain-containing protein [Meloidogyne graminicola]